jgi:DNA invertase Pin-like site-specific DNA recombinase
VWRFGGTVFAIDIGLVPRDDPDDPMKTALRQMVGVFAQLERGMIAARLRAGRRLKADRGEYAGFGSPPYGTRVVGGALLPHEAEQRTIALVRTLAEEGHSLRKIVGALDAGEHRPRRSNHWHPEMVRRIINRPNG